MEVSYGLAPGPRELYLLKLEVPNSKIPNVLILLTQHHLHNIRQALIRVLIHNGRSRVPIF